MTKSKLISLCLALVLVLSGSSACADPPKTSSPDNVPKPADQVTKEEEVKKPDPVDLSVLSKDETEKINHRLLDTLENLNKDDTVSITLYLYSPLDTSDVKKIATERMNKINKGSWENNISYNKTVSLIFDETNTPIIKKVMADYSLRVPHESTIVNNVMCIDCVAANAQTVVEMAKDERVRSIYTSSVSYEDAVAEIESVKASRKQI